MDNSDEKLRHLNKILRSIRDINQLIVHEKDLTSLITKACGILVRDQGYFSAWIALFPDDKSGYIFAEKGLGKDFDELKKSIINKKISNCAKKAIKTGEVVLIKDPSSECRDCVLSDKYKGRSAMTAAISYNEKNYGIITVSTSAIFESVEEEIDLFTEMAGDLGYAISSIEKERERLQAFALIEENKKKYQKLFDSANDMIYLHETKDDGFPGRILEVNETACIKMGYTREEFLKKSVQDLNDPDYEGDLLQIINKLNKEKNFVFEWIHLAKNGEKIPVEISVHNFVLEGENVALAVVRDISERKILEKELILTLNATTDGIWKWNLSTGELEFNSGYYTMLGYEPFEFPANYESWVSLIYPEDREKALETAEKYLETKPDNYENEFRLKTKDGGYKWIQASAKVTDRDKGGNALRLIGNHIDITDRITKEIKISEQKKFYENIIENIPDGIWITDCNDVIIYANSSIAEISGVDTEFLKGKSVPNDFDTGTVNEFIKYYNQARKTLKNVYYEAFVVTPAHKPTWQAGWLVPIIKENTFSGMICTIRDITKNKKQEEILRLTSFSVDKSPTSIFWIKPDGSFYYVNENACKEHGYSKGELLKLGVADVDPNYPISERKSLWRNLKKEKVLKIETLHKAKDGRIFPVEVISYYLNYKGEEFEIANSSDITQKKRDEYEILEKEVKYRELFNNVSEAVFLHKVMKNNQRGNFVEVNDTACQRLGYTRDELLEMTVADINTPVIRKDDIKRVKDLKKFGSIDFEGEHVRKDGSVFPVFVKARMIDIAGEKYIMSLVRDISEDKETKRREAEALMQIEKNLLQMAALNDKVRNPLSVIAGYLSLEEDRNTSELLLQQVKEIDDIITELDRGWLESHKIREFLRRHYGVD